MATITIAYTAPVAPRNGRIANICATFEPNNAAADLDVFNNTYYDTNVAGTGIDANALTKYMADQVAFPGIVAALRAAVANGTYTIENPTAKEVLYWGELKPALVDQGFTVTVDDGGDTSSQG